MPDKKCLYKERMEWADSIGRDELRRFLFADCHEITISIIGYAEKKVGKKLEEGYKNFLGLFYSEAIAGIIIERIKNPQKQTERETAIRYISNTIIESLTAIVKNSGTVPHDISQS